MRWLAAGVLGIACASAPGRAAAHTPNFSDGEVAVILVAFLSDLTFTVVNAVAATNDSRHDAWVIPQAVLSTPQAILFGVVEYDDDKDFIPVAMPIVINQLTAFSIYGLASPRVSTTALYGLSWGIGADAALTNNAVSHALGGMFVKRSTAITELVFAVPQLAVAGYALHSPEDFPRQRAAVLALGAWSSALLVHGVLSLALYRPKPLPSETPKKEQAWFVMPSLIERELGPAPGAGISRVGVPGLLMRGVF